MPGVKSNNFHPLEVVGRGSETQLQVGENLNKVNLMNLLVFVFDSSYYTVITGWCLYYFFYTAIHPLPSSYQESMTIFTEFAGVGIFSIYFIE